MKTLFFKVSSVLVITLLYSFSAHAYKKYSCTIREYYSNEIDRTHVIEFARTMSLTTDLVGPYQITFSDYVGLVSVVLEDSHGKKLSGSKTVKSGEALETSVPELDVTCKAR